MALEFTIDKTGFGKLSEDIQGLYKSTDDGYQLNVKGAVSKTKVDEFRDNNVELTNKLKSFDKVDLSKWDDMLKHEQDIADKKLIDAGDIDALVTSKLAVVESDYQAKLETANQQINELKTSNTSIVSKYEIQGATSKAFADNKISPTFHKSLSSQVNSLFTVKEGNVVAMEGDKIMSGKNGNLTINEFIEAQDDAFKIRSSGGGGQGGGGQGGTNEKTSIGKIASGLASLNK